MEKGPKQGRRKNPFKLRLPDRVRAEVKKIADAKGLSVNAWLCNLISRALDEQSAPPPSRT